MREAKIYQNGGTEDEFVLHEVILYDEKEYQREVQFLESYGNINHSNIIKILAYKP